jgi:hypothetical protein
MISFKYSTRFVIVFKNIVIKIPIDKKGYLQGINEKYIYNKYKNIAPIAKLNWMRFGIVCQKKYNTISKIPKKEVQNIKILIPEFNIKNCDLYNYENWGIENNNYILLDYGISKKIANLYKHFKN